MDASPDTLVNDVRQKRASIDRRLDAIADRLKRADPRRVPQQTWGLAAAPMAAVALVWMWGRRRRALSSVDALLVHDLRELYDAELRIHDAVDDLSDRATAPELKQLLDRQRQETDGHLDRLRRVFRSVGASCRRGRSAAITGLAADARRLARRKADPDVLDAALVAIGRRILHDGLATYRSARIRAEQLGYEQAAKLLDQTADEYDATIGALGHLADRFINPQSIRGRKRA